MQVETTYILKLTEQEQKHLTTAIEKITTAITLIGFKVSNIDLSNDELEVLKEMVKKIK